MLSYLKKLTVFAVILTLAFAPIAPGITTPIAHAEEAGLGAATCDLTKLDGTGIGNCVAGFIYIFTVGLGSAIAFVGAYFFNIAVHISLDAGAYSLDFVSAGWTTARDIANMAFIFILIYLAMTIMFQANTSGTMHTLVTVIIIALIINFSFFFTRIVIDAGNILAVQFYNAITANDTSNFQVDSEGKRIPDLTAGIMNGVDLQNALSSKSFKTFQKDTNTAAGFIPYVIALSFLYISMGAMFFMLAGAFFMAGAKFLTRIVMLWFMIIASPLALVARASGMKQIEHYYHDWQSNLIRNAFYPVAFLFIFWILSQFMSSLGTGGAIEKLFQDLSSSSTSTEAGNFIAKMAIFIANLGIRIGFVIAMIYIALEASKRFGVYGAAAAEKFGNTMSLGGLAGYAKGAAWAGRLAARPLVAPVTQFVGMGARDLSKTLDVRGLRTLTKPLRQNVLQPLTKVSLVGEKSFNQLEKEAKARGVIRKAIDTPDKLSDREKSELNHVDTDILANLSAKNIEKMGTALSTETIKKLEDHKNYSDDDKHNIRHSWDAKKSDEEIETLHKIDEKLGNLTTTIDGGQIALKDLLKKGLVLDKKNTAAIKTAFQTKADEAQVAHKEAEIRLQTAITQQTEATRAGNKAEADAVDVLIKEAKKTLVESKTIERNSNEGMKKLEKAPKEKGDGN